MERENGVVVARLVVRILELEFRMFVDIAVGMRRVARQSYCLLLYSLLYLQITKRAFGCSRERLSES